MVMLFRSGTIREKAWLIFKATRQHASNLARFALFYKSSLLVLKNVNGGKEESIHTFLAGLFGGYWVFGHGKGASSSVNQQIVIYVFARVVLALAKLAVQPPGDNSLVGSAYGGHGGKGFLGLSEQQREAVRRNAWPVFASVSWASVMWLFRWYPETLQPSLRSSMTYMYVLRSFHYAFLLFLLSFCAGFALPCFERLTQGLTTVSFLSDTRMRIIGTGLGISYGITTDLPIHPISILAHHLLHLIALPRRSLMLAVWLTLRSSFANSEHWHDLPSFFWQYNRPALPGMPAKPD